MTQLFSNHYLVYKVKNTDLYAAIAPSYQRDIRQYAIEYQSLSAVPEERTVQALVFRDIDEHLYTLKGFENETPVNVNQLEFSTDNFRLSA